MLNSSPSIKWLNYLGKYQHFGGMKRTEVVQLLVSPMPHFALDCVQDEPKIQREIDSKELEDFNERLMNRKRQMEDDMVIHPINFKHYEQLFNTIIERNQKYFTPEFGKTKQDFENYCITKTNMYVASSDFLSEFEPVFDLQSDAYDYYDFSYPLEHRIRNSKFSVKTTKSVSKFGRSTIAKMRKLRYKRPHRSQRKVQFRPFIYKLSDPEMLARGITVETKVLTVQVSTAVKLFLFSAILSDPRISGFFSRKSDRMCYPGNKICCYSVSNGSRILLNKNGRKVLAFIKGSHYDFFVVFSSKRRLVEGVWRPAPLALFDLLGNGVVFDEDGNKRLIYDQAQGILYDTPTKLPLKWKWKTYDKIARRKKELKNVKPDNIVDQDSLGRSRLDDPKEEMVGSKGKWRKKLSKLEALALKNKAPQVRKRVRLSTGELNSLRASQTRESVREEPESTQPVSKERPETSRPQKEVPLKLKLSRSGCAIEPLLPPCDEALRVLRTEAEEGRRSRSTSWRKRKASAMKEKEFLAKCFPKAAATTMTVDKEDVTTPITANKPIILRITNEISLTILNQKHIHLDFQSQDIHFMFEIGVTINTNSLKNLFSLPSNNELIPSIFEAMERSNEKLKIINTMLKQMREEAYTRNRIEQEKMRKKWGLASSVHFR